MPKNKKNKRSKGDRSCSTPGQQPVLPRISRKSLVRNNVGHRHIYTIDKFLTPSEAKAFIAYAEQLAFVAPPAGRPKVCAPHAPAATLAYAHTHTHTSYQPGYAVRTNARIAIDSPALAERLWELLEPLFPEPVDGLVPAGCANNIRFYRYEVSTSSVSRCDHCVRSI